MRPKSHFCPLQGRCKDNPTKPIIVILTKPWLGPINSVFRRGRSILNLRLIAVDSHSTPRNVRVNSAVTPNPGSVNVYQARLSLARSNYDPNKFCRMLCDACVDLCSISRRSIPKPASGATDHQRLPSTGIEQPVDRCSSKMVSELSTQRQAVPDLRKESKRAICRSSRRQTNFSRYAKAIA